LELLDGDEDDDLPERPRPGLPLFGFADERLINLDDPRQALGSTRP
jgi:hypothetical protein